MKKLVLRVHTQRVLMEGLYHRTLMGFKWQTRTKVLHDKPSFFVDTYFYQMVEHVLREELAVSFGESQQEAGRRLQSVLN